MAETIVGPAQWNQFSTGWRCRCCQEPSRKSTDVFLDGDRVAAVVVVPTCNCPFKPSCDATRRCKQHCKCDECSLERLQPLQKP